MTVTLVVPQAIADQFTESAKQPVETAGVLLVRAVRDANGDIKLLGRKMLWLDDSDYLSRSAMELRVTSEVYVRHLGEAEERSETAIWVHTHPNGGPPYPSEMDVAVDQQIADVFRIRTGSDFYGSLILSSAPQGYNFTGKLLEPRDTHPLTRIFSVGDRWNLRLSFDSIGNMPDAMFDRNVRAFGPAIQSTIGGLSVAIVGCGGTGSAVAEQLVRLGIRKLLLVDPDSVSESNLTRLYGSTPADVGRPKVDVVRDNLNRIAPSLMCDAVPGMITHQEIARRLTSADIVFGCSDDNAGRIVLSRLSTYFMIPVIDCGVLLASDSDGRLTDIVGRITTMVPGAACLICRGRIDLIRARTELLTPDERIRLENEGYAPVLGRVEPSVVTFTTSVASFAVTELLDRFIGFGLDHKATETLIRFHDREISTNVASPVGRHFCNPAQGKIGLGSTEPFLEQVWP